MKKDKKVADARFGPKATIDEYAQALYETFHGADSLFPDDEWVLHKKYPGDTVINGYRKAARKAVKTLVRLGIGTLYDDDFPSRA